MNLYANAKIKITEKNNFSDTEGKNVEYQTNYLKSDEGEVLEVNSSKDFSSYEGKEGLVCIRARKREGGGFKLSLIDFVEGGSVEVPTIEA